MTCELGMTDLSNDLFFLLVVVQGGHHAGRQHVVYQLQKSYSTDSAVLASK